ncbi:MAG TPA: EAL domain-containing protein [Candidatus Acidoferrum sp.]|nr:EAL domain-containing protein [Candidatus Acidoferrum sp.]
MTGKPLRVLVLEDRPDDAELTVHELRRAGYTPQWERVDDEAGFRAALRADLDLVLADYHQPGFDALRALRIMRAQHLDIPFIIVSGAIGEETAVAAVREGAADYVLKDRLGRLGTAVENALEQRALRLREQRVLEELRASERRYQDLVNSIAGVVWEQELPSRRLTFMSRRVESLLGYSVSQWLSEPGFWLAHIVDDDRDAIAAESDAVIAAARPGESVYRMRAADGRIIWVRDHYSTVLSDGKPVRVRGVLVDITPLKRTEELISLMAVVAEAANRTSSIETALQVGVDQICAATGWPVGHAWIVPDDEPGGRQPTELLNSPIWHLSDPDRFASFRRTTESMPSRVGDGLASRALKTGRIAWTDQQATNPTIFLGRQAAEAVGLTDGIAVPIRVGDVVVAVLEFFTDHPIDVDAELTQALEHAALQLGRVAERTAAARALERQATTDSLTEMPNRSVLVAELRQAIQAAASTEHRISLLLIDVDDFKAINDSFGHPAGDDVLRQIGPRIRGRVRGTDTVARLGGDEFAVLLRGAETKDAVRIGREILAALEQPVMVGNQPVDVHASFGVATFPDHAPEASTLMQRADVAMYVAKRSGSDFAIYAPENDPYDVNRVVLMGELRQALENGQLTVFYQPKIRIATRALVGFEALVRWEHPRRGWLPPSEFIPLAERTGLIKKVTANVLGVVVQQLAEWQLQGPVVPVAVNLSMRDLLDPHFGQLVRDQLASAGVDPRWFQCEITESVAMSEPERVMQTIRPLQKTGIQFAIDDFGTGYSSLAYLQRLPVREIKIDRSFVKQMAADDGSRSIVQAIVELGHRLGLEAVAEGIEDVRTFELLRSTGCDTGQGYLISKPVPASELDDWLRNGAWLPRAESERAA